eukprot:6199803-Pleurochrysis_carterae.AAC.2
MPCAIDQVPAKEENAAVTNPMNHKPTSTPQSTPSPSRQMVTWAACAHASLMPGILEVGIKKASPTPEDLAMSNSEMLGDVRKLMGSRRGVCPDGSCWVLYALLALMPNYQGTAKFSHEALRYAEQTDRAVSQAIHAYLAGAGGAGVCRNEGKEANKELLDEVLKAPEH